MRMRASFSYSRLHTLTVTLLQPMSLRLKFCNFAFLGPKMSFALREKPSVKKVSKKLFYIFVTLSKLAFRGSRSGTLVENGLKGSQLIDKKEFLST